MNRLYSIVFFIGFLAISCVVVYGVYLKLSYNALHELEAGKPYEREMADWAFGAVAASLASVAFSVVGLFWVKETLVATRLTARAAVEANEITRSQIETSERAWIVCKVKPVGRIRIEESGHWVMPIVVVNSNVGKTPALHVSTNVIAADMDDLEAAISFIKSGNRARHRENGIMLAPNDSYERKWGFSSAMVDPAYQRNFRIPDFIVGCVSYSTIFDDDAHSTIFVYHVSRDTGPDAGYVGGIYDGMPPEEVYLWPWNGSSAD